MLQIRERVKAALVIVSRLASFGNISIMEKKRSISNHRGSTGVVKMSVWAADSRGHWKHVVGCYFSLLAHYAAIFIYFFPHTCGR